MTLIRHYARSVLLNMHIVVSVVTTPGVYCGRRQDGSDGGNDVFRACTAFDDGSVIIAGHTEGDWDGANNGGSDFAVVKLNALGLEEWRWQVCSNIRQNC